MNPWQLSKQLRYLLRARTWNISGGGLVFGSVHITNRLPKDAYKTLRLPFCLISVGDAEPDPQHPGYVLQRFGFTYCSQVAGDKLGEFALIGGALSGGRTRSPGKGLLEVEEELDRAIEKLQEDSGVKIWSKWTSEGESGLMEGHGYVALRTKVITARCTSRRYYHPPLRVQATGGGPITITWADPPARWDSVSTGGIMIRKNVGATFPTSPTDGDLVAEVDRGVQTYEDSDLQGGTFTYYYSVFAAYDNRIGGENKESYSDGPSAEEGITDSQEATWS